MNPKPATFGAGGGRVLTRKLLLSHEDQGGSLVPRCLLIHNDASLYHLGDSSWGVYYLCKFVHFCLHWCPTSSWYKVHYVYTAQFYETSKHDLVIDAHKVDPQLNSPRKLT